MTEERATSPQKVASTRRKRASAAQRKRRARRPAPRMRTAGQRERLETLLAAIGGGAARTGRRIAAASGKGAAAARRAAGQATGASRRAARRVIAEWNRLDTPRKIEFMAALLGAVTAASAGVAGARKKK